MKRILYIITLVFILSACDDAFEMQVDNTYGDEYAWEIASHTTGILMQAYNAIPHNLNHYDGDFLDCATDNAVSLKSASAMARLAAGNLTTTSNPIGNWNTAYKQIQQINLFLRDGGLDDPAMLYHLDTVISDGYKQRLKGEAFFLRAWWTSELLRVYGGVSNDGQALGVPLMTAYASPDTDLSTKSRATYEATALQIFEDCDSAYALLPLEYNGPSKSATEKVHDGRADKKMCLALKSRIALYAASPAYQPSGISDAELKSKWERAALFAYNAIEDGNLGSYKALTTSVMFSKTIGTEYIFSFMQNNRAYEIANLPPSVFGNGYTNPSQNLVNAFPCSDGYPIGQSLLYNAQDPYANRDKRLALTVLCNGNNIDASGYVLSVYYNKDEDKAAKDAPGALYNNTRTGYYLRKWLSPKEDMLLVGAMKNDYHRIPLLRKAEVYLNLAEALNNAVGPNGTLAETGGYTAKNIITTIRLVSGGINNTQYLDDNANDANAFKQIILNERRIELAFEGHRYFDLRRTNSDLAESVYGMTCELSNGTLTYTGTESNSVEVEARAFDQEKYRYCPLPYSELQFNSTLINNKGW